MLLYVAKTLINICFFNYYAEFVYQVMYKGVNGDYEYLYIYSFHLNLCLWWLHDILFVIAADALKVKKQCVKITEPLFLCYDCVTFP